MIPDFPENCYLHRYQVQELVNYLVRNQPDEERAASIRPFQEALASTEGQKPLSEDVERRRKILVMILTSITGLGHGQEKGVWISVDLC